MRIERQEVLGCTTLYIYPEQSRGPWSRYAVSCGDFDIDHDAALPVRQSPTARISLLGSPDTSIEGAQRLATEYLFVAGAAAALQAEKRAAYAARFPEPSAEPKNQWLNSLSDYEDSMRGDDA